MRGHQPLIERRLAGWRTDAVFVADVGHDKAGCWRDWPSWAMHAHVELEAKDRVRRLDLRFAAGLTVHLDAEDSQRMRELSDAFLAAGAVRVVGAVHAWRGEELRCVEMVIREAETAPEKAAQEQEEAWPA
jgi:hypothetical protein